MAGLDTQTIEILGRQRLTEDLVRAGLEVATPLRDRGIDLIAYADLAEQVNVFAACPIQLKAASRASFSIHRKYERISNLLIVFVWFLDSPRESIIYALTHDECLGVADEMGYTATRSWASGAYSTTRPSRRLCELLEDYRMTPERWWAKVIGTSKAVIH